MKPKYSTCCSKISKYKCPHYLQPHYCNSKVFHTSKESNKKSWCALHDEELSYVSSRYCGMFNLYRIKISIEADAELLDGADSPYSLKVKLRNYLSDLLGNSSELTKICVEFEKVTEED